jgi:hypothetical protein
MNNYLKNEQMIIIGRNIFSFKFLIKNLRFSLRYLRLYYMYWKAQTRTHEKYQMNWRIVRKN